MRHAVLTRTLGLSVETWSWVCLHHCEVRTGAFTATCRDNTIHRPTPYRIHLRTIHLDLLCTYYYCYITYYCSLMHNIGFTPRPRLRGRTSFYDLIKSTASTAPNTATATDRDQSSAATAKLVEERPELIASTIPLPTSPIIQRRELPQPQSTSSIPEEAPQATEYLEKEANMVPVSFIARCCSILGQKLTPS